MKKNNGDGFAVSAGNNVGAGMGARGRRPWDEQYPGKNDIGTPLRDAILRALGLPPVEHESNDLPDWLKEAHARTPFYVAPANNEKVPVLENAAAPHEKIRPRNWRPETFRQLTEALKQGWTPETSGTRNIDAAPLSHVQSGETNTSCGYRPGEVSPMRRLVQKKQSEQNQSKSNPKTNSQSYSSKNNTEINIKPKSSYKPAPSMDISPSDPATTPMTDSQYGIRSGTVQTNSVINAVPAPEKKAKRQMYKNKFGIYCDDQFDQGPNCTSVIIQDPRDFASSQALLDEYERIYQASLKDKKEKACWINEEMTETGNCKTLERIDGGYANAPIPKSFGKGTLIHTHPKNTIQFDEFDKKNENGRGMIITKDFIYTYGYGYDPIKRKLVPIISEPISRKVIAKK